MASRIPPRHVPTLTEVVYPGAAGEAAAAAQSPAPAAAMSEDEIVQRVMRRVDASLERRLRETVAAAVIEQTRVLGPILQQEIESLVREAVAEALEQELGRLRR